jgi:cellulose synthase/poly-beta-1,6-N-acetylglucosamine synthase-like glycosyltransferase
MAAVLFWLALVSLVYGYFGFPLLVALVGTVRGRPVRRAPITPSMSLIIPAYNEEEAIASRIENALALDYPQESLEIIVASDGSSDATEAIVSRYASRGIRLLALPRLGKNRAIVEAVRHSTGEILVFSDANIFCEPRALRELAANFADPSVGGVSGNASYEVETGSESSSHGEDLYWNYDTRLKMLESRTGSIVSAHGALYAIRRALYSPPADLGAVDDFANSTSVVEQGYRLVFEPAARCSEVAIQEAEREFRRRVRNMTMGLRAVVLRRRLLNPFRYGFYSLLLFSHKILRRLLPVSLFILLVTSLLLSGSSTFYRAAAEAQALFYALAGLGYLARRRGIGRWKLLYMPFYYCMVNTAAVLALLRFVRGDRIAVWQPQRHVSGA